MRILKKVLKIFNWDLFTLFILLAITLFLSSKASAINISGQDISGDMETVGSLFKTADTVAFAWASPMLAGIFIIIGCIGLVRSNFMVFFLCFTATILLLLLPRIVGEIRKKGGDSVINSKVEFVVKDQKYV